MPDTCADFFDSIAQTWDERLAPIDFETIPKILARANLGASDSVLDIGAGTGILVPHLHSFGISSYCAIDISRGMADVFRRKFPTLPYLIGDFIETPFEQGGFSFAIIFNAFPHFSDKKSFLKKCFDVLKPGGHCLIAHSLTRDALNEHHRRKSPEVREHVLPDISEMTHLFREAGFQEVVVSDTEYFFSMGIKPERNL